MGPRPFGFPTERYYVEIDKENSKQRYKYRKFEKGADRHFFNTNPRQIKYVMGNKFILKGDEVGPNNEPDEKGDENWITTVIHDPADRQADGRWEGTIVQMKVPAREIRWPGLYDMNSDKLYVSSSS